MAKNSEYNIDKPLIKDKNWFIFPNAIFSQLETMDCNDAMEGVCYTDKTFDQCISTCEQSPECNFGYYISNLPGDNICVPLREQNVNSNPAYRLRRKDIYPILDNATTQVFINKNHYPFPPEDANTVFFMDNFTIENIETKTFLETSPMSQKNNDIAKFTENGDLIVQVLQVPPDLSAGLQYVPVKYGDTLVFNIPNTTLIMRDNPINETQMIWVPRSNDISQNNAYTILPIIATKNIGDVVSYSDTFSIHSNVSILGVDEHSHIEKLYYDTYKQAQDKGKNVTFRFRPKMKGWYCDNNSKCTEIPLSKMKINNKGIGTYDGLAIGRNPGCFGVCKYKIKNQPHLQPFDTYTEQPKNNNTYIIIPFIVILIILIVLIIIFILIRFKHSKSS